MTKSQLYAELPSDLIPADITLRQYGRWAMDRLKRRHCGSAEGRYRAPQDDADRSPRESLMPPHDAMRAQRALQAVPEAYRLVLSILYVPKRHPVEAQLRKARIPPRLAQERHAAGVRMFWKQWRGLA